MAGNWYRDDRGGSNQWRGDDDRSEGQSGGDHGFFERAGDEVRSWLGFDDERGGRGRGGGSDRAEPWGGGDWIGRDRHSHGRSGTSHYGAEHGFGGFQGDYGGGGGQGGFGGQGDYAGGRRSFSSQGSRSGDGRLSSLHDDHYRSWRDRQIEQMDREYEEYCRERQHSFQNDFDSWRRNRQGQGGSGLGASASTGSSATSGLMAGSGGTASGGDEGASGTGSSGSSRINISTEGADEAGPATTRHSRS